MSDLPEETPSVWGPDSCRAGVSVTFDNLGEAADLERGLWPEDEPLGRHFSVKLTLPRILDTLDELELRATFFVEGIMPNSTPKHSSRSPTPATSLATTAGATNTGPT